MYIYHFILFMLFYKLCLHFINFHIIFIKVLEPLQKKFLTLINFYTSLLLFLMLNLFKILNENLMNLLMLLLYFLEHVIRL